MSRPTRRDATWAEHVTTHDVRTSAGVQGGKEIAVGLPSGLVRLEQRLAVTMLIERQTTVTSSSARAPGNRGAT